MTKSTPDYAFRFRRSVYRHPSIPLGCKLMLIRMSEEMRANGCVSVPRDRLASMLNVSRPRTTEWVTRAKDAGFLSTVERGRPGVTAVYQLMIVGPESVPHLVRKTDKVLGPESVPSMA